MRFWPFGVGVFLFSSRHGVRSGDLAALVACSGVRILARGLVFGSGLLLRRLGVPGLEIHFGFILK